MYPLLQALQNLGGDITQLINPSQKLISPLPQADSPGGYNNPDTDPGLASYMARNYQASQITPQQAAISIASQQPKTIQYPSWMANNQVPQVLAANTQNPVQQALSILNPENKNKSSAQGNYQFNDFTTSKVPSQYANLIAQSALQNGIDPNILASLLFSEHGFQPTGISQNNDGSYDRGIAQINNIAHPEITDQQAQDPSFAIPWAAKLLGNQIKNLGLQRGIVAYNTGANGALNIANPTQFPYYKRVVGGLSNSLKKRLGL